MRLLDYYSKLCSIVATAALPIIMEVTIFYEVIYRTFCVRLLNSELKLLILK